MTMPAAATPDMRQTHATRRPGPHRDRPPVRRRLWRVLVPYGMLAPAILLFLAFLAAPILYTLVLSFQQEKVEGLGLGPNSRHTVFAGLANYTSSLREPELWAST